MGLKKLIRIVEKLRDNGWTVSPEIKKEFEQEYEKIRAREKGFAYS